MLEQCWLFRRKASIEVSGTSVSLGTKLYSDAAKDSKLAYQHMMSKMSMRELFKNKK